MTSRLSWFPESPDWRERLEALGASAIEDGSDSAAAWLKAVALARANLSLLQTNALDRTVQRLFAKAPAPGEARVAILSTSTSSHLAASIRVALLRRGVWTAVYAPDYGQSLAELEDPASALHRFAPTTALIAIDAVHAVAGLQSAATASHAQSLARQRLNEIRATWRRVRDRLCCAVVQQTLLPVHTPLLGENEHLLAGSPLGFVQRLNADLRWAAAEDSVDLINVEGRAARDGLAHWHSPAHWAQAKQEIAGAAAPVYGDLLARLIEARRGRSAKCLVMDLDNTLWGGVVGDDGVEGLTLGQGSALGEAFLSVQRYAKALAARGIILAVCSKNDADNAWAPFDRHPEMILRRPDIACLVANWQDKASNLKTIAQRLNIGLDSLVFLDDNPFERDLVRRELPMVAVPDLPQDPALYPQCLADAGYFESVSVTADDRERSAQYQANAARETAGGAAVDLGSYLTGLEMRLAWGHFDELNLKRLHQLINKTNQFNLTTRRYAEADVRAVMADDSAIGLHFRLSDRFGDNGVICVVILRRDRASDGDFVIDTWLMSCRVLGRGVEDAVLQVLRDQASAHGGRRLIGVYRPSGRNEMVADLYRRLGFSPIGATPDAGELQFALDLAGRSSPDAPIQAPIQIVKG